MPPAKSTTPKSELPRGTRTDTGRARRQPLSPAGGKAKPGRKGYPHKRSDITLPPAYIDAISRVAKRDGITVYEWQRLAVASYTKDLLRQAIEPRLTACPTCLRDFKAPRAQGKFKRLRVTVNFDTDTVKMLTWIAENFYYGVWSQAFENAAKFFLGKDAPPPEAEAR